MLLHCIIIEYHVNYSPMAHKLYCAQTLFTLSLLFINRPGMSDVFFLNNMYHFFYTRSTV